MELSPRLYHWLVRPPWLTRRYIHDVIRNHFDFQNKTVLDFGAGVGSNCRLFCPDRYLGVEPCQQRVKLALRMNPGYCFSRLEGNWLPAPSETFDYILVVAVLHHLSSPQLRNYVTEFRRVLKRGGQMIVMEPCLSKHADLRNWVMIRIDRGKYIRSEEEYQRVFADSGYETKVLRRFRKLLLYNELFFTATPTDNAAPLPSMYGEECSESKESGLPRPERCAIRGR
jgi:SAM-dependent methyltransferase